MHLVQHRLDCLSSDNIGEISEVFPQQEFPHRESSLSNHDKIDLMGKLEELEAKKENMDAMIQRVKHFHRRERENGQVPGNSEYHNIRTSLSHKLNAPKTAFAGNLKDSRDWLQLDAKPKFRSADGDVSEVWSTASVNNQPVINSEQIIPTASSPTLSLLDNLRALENPHQNLFENDGQVSKDLHVNYKNLKHYKSKNNASDQQMIESPLNLDGNEQTTQQFGIIQNSYSFTETGASRPDLMSPGSFNSLQLDMPNVHSQVYISDVPENFNQLNLTHEKTNNIQSSSEFKSPTNKKCFKNSRNDPSQVTNINLLPNGYRDPPPTGNVIAIRDQINQLQSQIDCLYDEISATAMTTEMPPETKINSQVAIERGSNLNTGINAHTNDSCSSMLNNTLTYSNIVEMPSFKENTTDGSSRRYHLNRRNHTSNNRSYEDKFVNTIRLQKQKEIEQQKVITQLTKSLNSCLYRLTVVENDIDGFNGVLRSLIDIIDNKAQQHMPYVEQESRNMTRSTSKMPAQKLAGPNFAKHRHQNIIENSNKEEGIRQSSVSSLSSNARKIPTNRQTLHTTPDPNNDTILYTDGTTYRTNMLPRVLSPFENRTWNGQRETLQHYDNEPWRNFEIDMSNGLRNASFVPFASRTENPLAISQYNQHELNPELVSGPNERRNDLITSFNSVDSNNSNKLDMSQYSSPFPSIIKNSNNHAYDATSTVLADGFQHIIEPSLDGDNFVHEAPNLADDLRFESDENNSLLRKRQRGLLPKKEGIKSVLPAFKTSINETASSVFMNTSLSPIQVATTTSALNNQVPPGRRSNNYWDNFKSYSRQNRLESTSCTTQNTNTIPVRPTAAVGAIATISGQGIPSIGSVGSPMVAQVPPRQLESNSNATGGIAIAGVTRNTVGTGRASESIKRHENQNFSRAIDANLSLGQRRIHSTHRTEENITRHIAGADRRELSTNVTQSLNNNSALVEPYFSNAHSPLRPRRKQKINREQNIEMNPSNSVLEADRNIVQAAAMARAVANNSAAINRAYALPNGGNNSVNCHITPFNSNNSRAINDLNFYTGTSNFRPFDSHNLRETQSTNIAARVYPILHQSHSEQDLSRNLSTNDNQQPINFSTIGFPQEYPSVSENPDVSNITQSILGYVKDLISQTQADPERLRQLFEVIHSANIAGLVPNIEDIQEPSNFASTKRQTYQREEIGADQINNMASNFGDISADDEDETITSTQYNQLKKEYNSALQDNASFFDQSQNQVAELLPVVSPKVNTNTNSSKQKHDCVVFSSVNPIRMEETFSSNADERNMPSPENNPLDFPGT